jgi:hypothetical protein
MTQDFPASPLSDRVGSRRFRRRLVAATYGGWLLVAAVLTVLVASNPHFPALVIALLANSIVLLVMFGRRTYLNREVLGTDAGLDERLVQNRNLAFRRAFQMLAFVVVIAWPASLVVTAVQPGMAGLLDAGLIFFGVTVLATTLPTAVWLWREPDPEAE